jgi:hypothetical protein
LTQNRIAEHETAGAGSSAAARRFDARRWLLIFLGFNAVALCFILQQVATRMARGAQIEWQPAVGELAYWYVWLPMLPLVFWTARTRRFEPGQRLRATLAHVAVGLFCGVIHAWVYLRIVGIIEPLPPGVENRGAFLFYLLTAFWKYFVFVGIYYAFLYYRRSRDNQLRAAQLESHLAQARLGALRSQLHPHFLFNTMSMRRTAFSLAWAICCASRWRVRTSRRSPSHASSRCSGPTATSSRPVSAIASTCSSMSMTMR